MRRDIWFLRKMTELRTYMGKSHIKQIDWIKKEDKPKVHEIMKVKNRIAGFIINEMMRYIVNRVMDGDICRIPGNSGALIYMGYNYPLAIEKMRKNPKSLFNNNVIPAYIRICSPKQPNYYLTVLMRKSMREKMVAKVNSGIEYYQPISLVTTYHKERKKAEVAAWERIMKEKECSTLTWTI